MGSAISSSAASHREELLKRAVLLVGVGLAVVPQQPYDPPLHVLGVYLEVVVTPDEGGVMLAM
jgi:hypothetical protein